MIDIGLFRNTVKCKHDSASALSEALGLTVNQFFKSVSSDAGFTVPEMQIIKERYRLSAAEASAIFFARC